MSKKDMYPRKKSTTEMGNMKSRDIGGVVGGPLTLLIKGSRNRIDIGGVNSIYVLDIMYLLW